MKGKLHLSAPGDPFDLRPVLLMLFLVSVFITASGCTASKTEPTMVDRDGIDAMVMTEDQEVTYIKKPGDLERICASRGADSVATSESAIVLGFSGGGGGENLGEQTGRGELGLGGRSPSVLITRELLYRACELTNNLNTDEATTIEIYKMFLQSLERIVKANLGVGTQSLGSYIQPPELTPQDADTDEDDDDDDDDDWDDDDDNDDDDDDDDNGNDDDDW